MAIKTYKNGSQEKLSANLKVSEFTCNGIGCCSSVMVDEQLVGYLQKIRDHFGRAITITSGYRCAKHNKNVGGAANSRHVSGQAADIKVNGVAPAIVAKYAESIGIKGIGLYESANDGYFTHIDTRDTKSFWYGKAQARRDTFGGAPINQEECNVNLMVLKIGSKGDTVKAMQTLLIGYGYTCGCCGADGYFGNGTQAAVRNYQKDNRLTVDGICGLKTWAELLGTTS